MKGLLIFFTSFFIICCNKNKQYKNTVEISKKIEDNRFTYILYFKNIDDYKIKYERLNIVDKKTGKPLQKIDLSIINSMDIPNNIKFLQVKDVNFDEINDIEIIQNVYAYSVTSSFWIFDKKTNQFIHYKKMDEIDNPIILKDKKEICSYWHGGQNTFNLFKYSWQQDSLIVKEKYEEEWLGNNGKGQLKISKFENGKWKTSEKEIKERFVENLKCE